MLPHVIRFNGAESAPGIATCWNAPAARTAFRARKKGAEGLADFVPVGRQGRPAGHGWRSAASSARSCAELAADAAKQWTGGFNPRKVGEAELLTLYEAAY